MWRLLGPVLLIAAIVLAYIVVAWYRRRDARLRLQDAREAELEAYRQRAALEDLERHRRRIEKNLDDMHAEPEPGADPDGDAPPGSGADPGQEPDAGAGPRPGG